MPSQSNSSLANVISPSLHYGDPPGNQMIGIGVTGKRKEFSTKNNKTKKGISEQAGKTEMQLDTAERNYEFGPNLNDNGER